MALFEQRLEGDETVRNIKDLEFRAYGGSTSDILDEQAAEGLQGNEQFEEQ